MCDLSPVCGLDSVERTNIFTLSQMLAAVVAQACCPGCSGQFLLR